MIVNILPMHSYQPKDRPWVIRLLRLFGYLIVILFCLGGFTYGYYTVVYTMRDVFTISFSTARVVCAVLGAIFGLLLGALVSVPYWGLAMVLDDIHAIRIQSSAYVALSDKDSKML